MRLDDLNRAAPAVAEQAFLQCCGSTRWARDMTADRPFRNPEALFGEAERLWAGLDVEDWLEAFAAHPRLGEPPPAAADASPVAATPGAIASDWSAREQGGLAAATGLARQRLAAANRDYEDRFGFTYLVCATGRNADELIAMAERRLTHSREEELRIAADEQRQITRLRLVKLLALQ